MKKILGNNPIRRIIQLGTLFLVFSLALGHQYLGVEKVAPIDAYCPFGEIDCEFPGDCVRYIDQDKNKICDRSE